MEHDFVFTAEFTDGGDVLDDTDFVVHPHHGNQNGVGADGGFELFQINQAVFFYAQIGYFKALAFHFAHGVQHGFVFGFNGNQVLAFGFVELGRAFDGEVVGFGCAAGEDDFFGVGVDERGDVGAGFFHRFFGFPAVGVAAGCGVAEFIGEIGQHFFQHARVQRGGGGVV